MMPYVALESTGLRRLDAFARNDRRLALYWAGRFLHNPDAIDECVQQAFARAAEHIEKYDIARPFEPWFRKVVERECLQFLRRGNREMPLEDCDLTHAVVGMQETDACVIVMQQEEQVRKDRERAYDLWLIAEAVRTMQAEKAEILLESHYQDTPHAEIGMRHGKNTETINSILHRARKELRRKVGLLS